MQARITDKSQTLDITATHGICYEGDMKCMYNTVNLKTNDRAFGGNILILQLTVGTVTRQLARQPRNSRTDHLSQAV